MSIGSLSGLAWLILVKSPHLGAAPSGSALHPPELGLIGFLLAALVWFVMMVAMMLPSVTPWLLLSGSVVGHARGPSGPYLAAALFGTGYFSIWLGYSLVAASLQIGLSARGLLGVGLRFNSWIGGALLIAAAIFQLTPIKRACLRHCRNPLGFFLSRWQNGPPGAVRMGFQHGLYCLGCCWALMALSFALGLMNLIWMAALTVFIAIEKLTPGGEQLGRIFGWVLAAWGIWLMLAGV